MGDLHPLRASLLVGVGGSLGALARFYVGVAAKRWLGEGWPFGTLIANLLGCLMLGLMTGMAAQGEISASTRAALMVGFLGAFTTFSTFCLEATALSRGSAASSGLYVAVSVVGGVALVWLGHRLGS